MCKRYVRLPKRAVGVCIKNIWKSISALLWFDRTSVKSLIGHLKQNWTNAIGTNYFGTKIECKFIAKMARHQYLRLVTDMRWDIFGHHRLSSSISKIKLIYCLNVDDNTKLFMVAKSNAIYRNSNHKSEYLIIRNS